MSPILKILSSLVKTLSVDVGILSLIGEILSLIWEILSLIWEILSPNLGDTVSTILGDSVEKDSTLFSVPASCCSFFFLISSQRVRNSGSLSPPLS